MAETYVIGWSYRGTTKIVADSPEEASDKLDRMLAEMSGKDLAAIGELDVDKPMTEAEAAEAEKRFDEFMRGERENFLNG